MEGQAIEEGRGSSSHYKRMGMWHIDISTSNITGTFYYLCSVLDGYSRSIVHWDLRESMRKTDIEIILERAKEQYPEARPRILSDNRAAVSGQGLQGGSSASLAWNAPCEPRPVLSAVERETGALAQIAEKRMHSTGNAAVSGRCAPLNPALRGPLQPSPSAQRDPGS